MAGRAQRDSGDEILAEINVIPFVDISLVLLLIFMVTANFIVSSDQAKPAGIDIPKVKHGRVVTNSKQVNIYVAKDGVIYLEKKPLLVDELADELEALKASDPGTNVIVQADKSAQFQYLAAVLDVINSVDLKNFSIAVEKEG